MEARITGHRRCGLIARTVFWLSLLFYVCSFALPAFDIVIDQQPSSSFGYQAFLIGIMAPFSSPYYGGPRAFASWLANPLFWWGTFQSARYRCRQASIAGGLATILAASLLIGEGNKCLLREGYYVWLMSMGMFALVSTWWWRNSRTSSEMGSSCIIVDN